MSDKARSLLERAVKGRYDDDTWWHEARAFLAQPEPAQTGAAAREAALIEKLRQFSLILTEEVTHGTLSLGFGPDWPAKKVQLAIDRLLIAGASPAAAALPAQEERLREWAPILEAAQRQDIRWKKPMPEIDFGDEAIFIWALKAQEEMGELSAALLGGLIGKEGRGDVLEECYQLIAVLLRIARAALAPGEE